LINKKRTALFRELENIEIQVEKAKKELLKNKETFKDLYEESPLPYQSLNKDGNIIAVNKAWLDELGYSHREVTGKLFGDLLGPGYRDKFKKDFNRFKASGEIRGVEFELVKKDETRIIVSFNGKIAYDEEGNFIQTHCIFENITKRKQMEDEITKSREDLKRLTAHIQSIREEERAFISGEIHDEIGQALAALRMDLYRLEKKIPKDQKELTDIVQPMKEVLDKTFLTTREIYASLSPTLLEHFTISEVIKDHMSKFQVRTGIKSEIDIEAKEIKLEKDRSIALFRIFQEALNNVEQHVKATKIIVRLTERRNKLELIVKDNGKGITDEKVNDPKSYGLMGMNERTGFLGGKLSIKGVPGKGTTVTITIPLHVVD